MTTTITVTEEEERRLQAMGFKYIDYSLYQSGRGGYWRRYWTTGSAAMDIDYNEGALSKAGIKHPYIAYTTDEVGRGFDNIISAAAWLLLQGEQS